MWLLSFCVKGYHHSELLSWRRCSAKPRWGWSSHTQFTRNYHALIPCPTYPHLHIDTVPCSLRMVSWLPPFFPRLHALLFWNHKLIFWVIESPRGSGGSEPVCYQVWPIPGFRTQCRLHRSTWPSWNNQNQPPWPGTIQGSLHPTHPPPAPRNR